MLNKLSEKFFEIVITVFVVLGFLSISLFLLQQYRCRYGDFSSVKGLQSCSIIFGDTSDERWPEERRERFARHIEEEYLYSNTYIGRVPSSVVVKVQVLTLEELSNLPVETELVNSLMYIKEPEYFFEHRKEYNQVVMHGSDFPFTSFFIYEGYYLVLYTSDDEVLLFY